MLKSLFATCLTALSVNTQPLSVSPTLEPSRAISEDSTFNVGDIYHLDFELNFGDVASSFDLLLHPDEGPNSIRFLSYEVTSRGVVEFVNYFGPLPFDFDFCFIYTAYERTTSIGSSVIIAEFDNTSDSSTQLTLSIPHNPPIYHIQLSFELLEGFQGFSTDSLPYLTKVEKPYTPPAKSNLYRLLYDFYYSIFNDDDLSAISTSYNMPFDNWLAHTCTIATLLTLVVVAFFFLRWLFKVISGLVLLKR